MRGISEQRPTTQTLLKRSSIQEEKRREHHHVQGRWLRRMISQGTITVIAVSIGLFWSVPTFGLFISSLRPPELIATTGWWTGLALPWNFTLQNYQQVLAAQGFGRAFLNSLIIAIPGTIFPLLIGSCAAYAFAWMRFPGRDLLFSGIIALLVIPLQIALAPILALFTAIGITGQYTAIWLAHTAFGLPFAIFLLRNFFASLPADLLESAHIDGASHLRIFWNIVLPLSVPALGSLTIFQFMWVWNDLLVALIFLGGNPQRAPMTVTIANLVDSYGTNYQVLTAAAFISMALPLVIFFSLQRYFVRGILAGSIKG
ncbi:carbohydrate ABC transporter permease [Dictyobacter formicarum]|uniref:Sugar ABC transporter permease n=1 Tax=Dictyobacter formicarum TaxID=2778368 RepID=A0ABQ3VSM3_9CHLR|nr:carbohydrate ABC transporter permease [Dictyobacter formicarum]GHO88699.1 sugar ABC transporter permease [Dictyobacter formicarum]